MAKKTSEKEKTLNLESILFNCRDYLRGNASLMDLRQWTQNTVKGEQKKEVGLDAEQVKRTSEIYFKWQSEGTDGTNYAEPELFRSVGIDELAENDFTLVPSRYIEFVDRDLSADYHQVLSETTASISDLLRHQSANDTTIRNALKQLGQKHCSNRPRKTENPLSGSCAERS